MSWVSAGIFHILEGNNLNISEYKIYLTTVLCISSAKIFRINRKKCISILNLNRISESRPYKLNLGVKEAHPERQGAERAGVAGEGREGEDMGGPSK